MGARQTVESDSQPNLRASYPPPGFPLSLRSFQRVFGRSLPLARSLSSLARQAANPAGDAVRLSLSVRSISYRLGCVLFQLRCPPPRPTSLSTTTRLRIGERTLHGQTCAWHENPCMPSARPRTGRRLVLIHQLYTARFFQDFRYGSFESDTRRFFEATYCACIS